MRVLTLQEQQAQVHAVKDWLTRETKSDKISLTEELTHTKAPRVLVIRSVKRSVMSREIDLVNCDTLTRLGSTPHCGTWLKTYYRCDTAWIEKIYLSFLIKFYRDILTDLGYVKEKSTSKHSIPGWRNMEEWVRQ